MKFIIKAQRLTKNAEDHGALKVSL